jgi:hypothetical protein
MQAIELLNQHLDEIITLGGKQFPKEKVVRVWNKLHPPIPEGYFYEGQRVKGRISPYGEVDFQVYYPETGWTFDSLLELGISSSSPPPRQELIKMQKSFKNLLDSPEGKVVYTNNPTSSHRARAYEKIGFSPVPYSSEEEAMEMAERGFSTAQILDNRRFQNFPIVKEMYEVIHPADAHFKHPSLLFGNTQMIDDEPPW